MHAVSTRTLQTFAIFPRLPKVLFTIKRSYSYKGVKRFEEYLLRLISAQAATKNFHYLPARKWFDRINLDLLRWTLILYLIEIIAI